jgi:hypothetical protein
MDFHVLTASERRELFDEHPVITKEYTVVTPVIKMVYELLRDRVWMRSTGTFMYATPRMGKSTCARAIKLLLEAEFPKILIIHFTAEDSKQTSALFLDILQSENIRAPRSARYKDIQRQLFTHIQSKLIEKKGQQLVLMIDEMQSLKQADLDMLATMHNRLETLGIKMTTLGFAHPAILALRASLKTTDDTYLIARFLSEPIPFDGCATKENLKAILRAYDDELVFPDDSNCTYTQFFLPHAYENGLKISDYSDDIWKKLRNASAELVDNSIPMEHLSRTIEHMLVGCSKNDMPKFKFSNKDILDAVESSNLRSFSSSIG